MLPFVVNTVPADGLALLGARSLVGTVIHFCPTYLWGQHLKHL